MKADKQYQKMVEEYEKLVIDMPSIIEKRNKITTKISPEIWKKIHYHLELMASINANVGIDSLPDEKKEIRKRIKSHLDEIKILNWEFYNLIASDEIKK